MRRAVFCSLIFIGMASLAAAQQRELGSKDPLMDICAGFLAQSGQGVSGDAGRLCMCLTRETQARLSRPEMEAYARATSNGQPPPDAVMQKVMGIATQCLSEAK